MSYSYHISFNKAVPSFAEFFPEGGVQTTNKQIVAQEFFREECSEIKITRIGNQYGNNETVYDQLESWFFDDTKFDDEIEIEIYRGTLATGTLYFAGFFSVSDGTIDRQNRTFKFTPRIDDEYRGILEVRDARFDVRGDMNDEDIVLPADLVIANWNAGSPSGGINDFDTFNVGGNNGILTLVEDTDGANREAKYTSLGNLTSGNVLLIDITAYAQNDSDPLIDIVDAADNSVTSEGQQTISGTGLLRLTLTSTVNSNLMIYTDPASDQTDFSMTFTLQLADDVRINQGKLYMEFIEVFITNSFLMGLTGLVGDIKSTFLNNDALPSDAPSSIVSFISGNPNGNYVSLDPDNPLNEFIISETRYWVDGDVTEIMVSFNDLMSDIKQTIECGWYFDADGDFRIEHVKYFEKLRDDSVALDLTSAPFEKDKPETDAKELTMNKALLANREQFEWQQVNTRTLSLDFVGNDIIYDNLETIENVLRHEARNITTDIVYLDDNQSDAAADGLVYLQCFLSGGDYIIEFETGVLSTNSIANGHFSWANLQDKYWTWRRMSENGDMNALDTILFDSAVKFMEQANVRFGLQTTLDPYTKITTSQGTGQQTEVVRSLDTDFLTMLISYNPYA